MNRRLIILGASGHGKVAADIAMHRGYDEILFLDDNPELTECLGWPVVGRISEADAYQGDFFVAIGNPKLRESLQNRLEGEGKPIVSLIHPSAVIGCDAVIGAGTVIMAGAVINPCAVIGRGCIINTCASVDHDCVIGDFAHVSVGAHVSGTVTIGARTWIGVGAAVKNNLTIAADCMIGAGAVVVRDIKETGTYIGIPARKAAEPAARRSMDCENE